MMQNSVGKYKGIQSRYLWTASCFSCSEFWKTTYCHLYWFLYICTYSLWVCVFYRIDIRSSLSHSSAQDIQYVIIGISLLIGLAIHVLRCNTWRNHVNTNFLILCVTSIHKKNTKSPTRSDSPAPNFAVEFESVLKEKFCKLPNL